MTDSAEVAALRARIAALEEVARGNKDHVGWLSDAYEEHESAIAASNATNARLRHLLGTGKKLMETLNAAHEERGQQIDRLRDLLGRIHRFGTIPDALQAEANNWIPDEWLTK